MHFFFYHSVIFSVVQSYTSLNLQMRLSIKWGGAQLIPTAFTLSLLFMASRHCWKLSPDGAFSPSTQLKQIQDGILMFSSSSNSTQAWNCQFRCYIKRQCITKTVEVRIRKYSLFGQTTTKILSIHGKDISPTIQRVMQQRNSLFGIILRIFSKYLLYAQ